MRLSVADVSDEDLFDVCIIGTGPAGVTCALSLARPGRRIALLEGGGESISDWSQDLYRGEVVGDPYFDLDACRLRYFGGTSNHWAGMCRPLDAADFEARGSLALTAWPIGKRDLDRYVPEASEILEIPGIPPDRPVPGGVLNRIDFVPSSPPVSFAAKFGARIDAEASVFLMTDANLLRLETNGPDITGARVVTSAGLRRSLRARCFVLATGGIENSRLLLWSNAQAGGQVVKNPETLGRYWMEHPHAALGEAIVSRDLDFESSLAGHMVFFAPTPATLSEYGILNCNITLEMSPYYEGARRLIADIACVAPEWATWAARQLGRNLTCAAQVYCGWEQEPRAENRVELGPDLDSLGVPRPRLHWRKSEIDRRTPRLAAEAVGVHLAATDAGRMRLDPWVLGDGDFPAGQQWAGNHHMGGTRMANAPASGVVDRDCKVFGQSNLYVAGSSVFPSGGYAPPTLTIVQLALRLADHLEARL